MKTITLQVSLWQSSKKEADYRGYSRMTFVLTRKRKYHVVFPVCTDGSNQLIEVRLHAGESRQIGCMLDYWPLVVSTGITPVLQFIIDKETRKILS